MGAMASQITSLTIVYSNVYYIKKSMSLAFVSPVTGEFPAQMANNAENVSIWWRYHGENCFCMAQSNHLSIVYKNKVGSQYFGD